MVFLDLSKTFDVLSLKSSPNPPQFANGKRPSWKTALGDFELRRHFCLSCRFTMFCLWSAFVSYLHKCLHRAEVLFVRRRCYIDLHFLEHSKYFRGS